VRAGNIRRLIVSLPPRHLKSPLASVAFPAWCLGHEPSAQILCVSYAQEPRRQIVARLPAHPRQRLVPAPLPDAPGTAPSGRARIRDDRPGLARRHLGGGVPTGRGVDLIVIDDPLKPEEALSQTQRQAANEW
jgi:hypothetical protein